MTDEIKMSDRNKVSVTIYGQEYKIAGEASSEYIMKLADYVDEKMVDMSRKTAQFSSAMVATLTAINIADEFFKLTSDTDELQSIKDHAAVSLSEKNSKINELIRIQLNYKNEAEQLRQKNTQMLKRLKDKEEECGKLVRNMKEFEKKNNHSKEQEVETISTLNDLKIELEVKNEGLAKLRGINKELENSFFDCQMENVQLKKELEGVKRKLEQNQVGY